MVPPATRNLVTDMRRFAMSVAGVAFAVLLDLILLSLYRVNATGTIARELSRRRTRWGV
jgi:hypothetical protein